jgi:hypothetical protein
MTISGARKNGRALNKSARLTIRSIAQKLAIDAKSIAEIKVA